MTPKRWIGLMSVGIVGAVVGAGGAVAVLMGPLHFRATNGVSSPIASLVATAPSPTATAPTAPTNSPTNGFFAGALDFAIRAAEQKTGLHYASGGCGSGQSCLSNAIETDGENATYIGLDASGYSGGTKCYVYLHQDPILGWQTFQLLCGSQPGFSPVYGQTVPVRVTGGCANVRQGPGLNSPIVGCLSNGIMVKITATPTFGDNKMWWGVAGDQVAGFMSQEFLVG